MPPSDPGPLVGYLNGEEADAVARAFEDEVTFARHDLQDCGSPEAAAIGILDNEWHADYADDHDYEHDLSGDHENHDYQRHQRSIFGSSAPEHAPPVAAGGDARHGERAHCVRLLARASSFCIIPFRRGVERSRPLDEIVTEVRGLVDQGVREVMLLGQIVDRYGDFAGQRPDLADLLHAVHEIDGLWRILGFPDEPSQLHDRPHPAGCR